MKYFSSFFLLLILLLRLPTLAFAQDSIYISPILPQNQDFQVKDHYDLTVKKNQQQLIQFSVNNPSNEEITILVQLGTGITNSNGTIEYTADQKRFEKDVSIPFSEIAQLEKNEYQVPPKDSIVIDIHIQMPDQEFDGIILGGISVVKKEKKEATSQYGVINSYKYILPVKLSQNKINLKPIINLTDVSLESGEMYDYLNLHMANESSIIIRNISMKVDISDKKINELVSSWEATNMMFAPSSTFKLRVPLDDDRIDAGDYRSKIFLKADGIEQTWEKDFKISQKQERALLADSVKRSNRPSIMVIIVTVVATITLLVLLDTILRKGKTLKGNRKQRLL